MAEPQVRLLSAWHMALAPMLTPARAIARIRERRAGLGRGDARTVDKLDASRRENLFDAAERVVATGWRPSQRPPGGSPAPPPWVIAKGLWHHPLGLAWGAALGYERTGSPPRARAIPPAPRPSRAIRGLYKGRTMSAVLSLVLSRREPRKPGHRPRRAPDQHKLRPRRGHRGMDDAERLGALPQVLVDYPDHEAAAIVAALGGA